MKLNLKRLKLIKSGVILGAQLLLPSFFMANFAANVSLAAELSEIRDRGYLTVAVKNNRAPLGFIDQNGNLSGFEIEIAQRLAEELLGDKSAIRFVPVQNVDRLNAVLENRVDIAIAAITITEPRRRLINFSHPYYLDGTAFITNQPNIQTLSDLQSANIALLNRSSTVPHVRYILPVAGLTGVTSYTEGENLLVRRQVDAFAGDVSVLANWLKNSDAAYRILPSIISAEPLSIAIPKGTQHAPLKEAVNQSLRDWYSEGWLQERAAYWGLPAESSQFVNIGPAPTARPNQEAPINEAPVDIDIKDEQAEPPVTAPTEESAGSELPNIGPSNRLR